jgi:hypothetical protein
VSWPINEMGNKPVSKSQGVTPAERYLNNLAQQSFLSLWSYPGVFRDQGRKHGRGDGKELCDLLVVFDPHVLIFSDKDCEFFDTGDLSLEWRRWFKKAVLQSARQLWGAERWVKGFPEGLFLDRSCKTKLPIPIPHPSRAIFHRVVVAHGASRRSKQKLGGTGSMMINSLLAGDEHLNHPFTIGRIHPGRGFVHVFDDTTLDIVMETLNTITDFVAYLMRKEQFLTGSRAVFAAGEEELLAAYLAKLNDHGEHDFVFPAEMTAITLDEGHWAHFVKSPERKAQLEADRISYAWDALVEVFAKHLLGGTQFFSTHPGDISEQEKAFRFLARECRTRRRLLATALRQIIEKTSSTRMGVRVLSPSREGDPYYVFLIVPRWAAMPEAEYREGRHRLLTAYCAVAKVQYPDARFIVGFATEAGHRDDDSRSEDLVCLDATAWTPDMEERARVLQKDLGLLTKTQRFSGTFKEYPSE